MERGRIHLAIAFDNNYLNPFYALITSIFNNNADEFFSFHCITRSVSEKEKLRIRKCIEASKSSINFYEVDEKLIAGFVTMNHWNTSVYYKLFFPLLVNGQVERILYLDTDTLVVNSLRELYTIDLETYPLAVVKDIHVGKEVYSKLHERDDYFNSGVMLVDVKKWNSLKISQQTINYLNDFPENITYVDQDALNVVLENKYILLPEKFNFTYTHLQPTISNMERNRKLKDLVIIHFTISRPWHFLCKNRFRGLYRHYLRKSPRKWERVVTDFSISKIPAYCRIRLVELYFDLPLPLRTNLKKCGGFIPYLK